VRVSPGKIRSRRSSSAISVSTSTAESWPEVPGGHDARNAVTISSSPSPVAHLVDHVFPPLPVRQWVLSLPKRLRCFLQRESASVNAVPHIFLRSVEAARRVHGPGAGPPGAAWVRAPRLAR
jgi:hypothetical protein